MAWYSKAVRKELPANDRQGAISPRTIAQHTAVSNGSSLFNYFDGRSEGVESHFYLQKDGGLEQYVSTTVRADCQNDANAFAVSIETWDGYPYGWDNGSDVPAFTTAQVNALAELYAWLHRTHGIPLRISRYWNDSGVGWHRKYIGDPGWARSARACPGDRRIAQIPGIIALAQRIVDGPDEEEPDVAISADELSKMLDTKFDAAVTTVNQYTAQRTKARISQENADRYGYSKTEYQVGAMAADASYRTRSLQRQLGDLSVSMLEGMRDMAKLISTGNVEAASAAAAIIDRLEQQCAEVGTVQFEEPAEDES